MGKVYGSRLIESSGHIVHQFNYTVPVRLLPGTDQFLVPWELISSCYRLDERRLLAAMDKVTKSEPRYRHGIDWSVMLRFDPSGADTVSTVLYIAPNDKAVITEQDVTEIRDRLAGEVKKGISECDRRQSELQAELPFAIEDALHTTQNGASEVQQPLPRPTVTVWGSVFATNRRSNQSSIEILDYKSCGMPSEIKLYVEPKPFHDLNELEGQFVHSLFVLEVIEPFQPGKTKGRYALLKYSPGNTLKTSVSDGSANGNIEQHSM